MQHYNVKPLALTLRPSWWLTGLLLLAGLSACVLIMLLPISVMLMILILLSVVVSVCHAIWRHALRRGSDAITGMDVSAQGKLRCCFGQDTWLPVQIMDTSYVTPWMVVLNLGIEGKRLARHVILLPDAADADTLRRLRVWLKWGRPLPDDRAKLTR